MKKYEIVKEKRDFDNIINTGKYYKNNYFVIYYKANNLNFSRFGLAIGKKIGNAVTRNKFKRKIRMIINNNKKSFKNNKDYIIIMKTNAINLDFKELNDKFMELFNG